MTKKYQLLLHIGLRKTATTSLQQNVLYPLHQEGKINLLNTRIAHKKDFLQMGGEKAELLLVENKLNVLSDENLSASMFFNVDDLLYNLKHFFYQL